MSQQTQPIEKFRELVREFDNAMLVSADLRGGLHGRPMQIVANNRDRVDDLWFVTSLDSGKISEIRADPSVAVIMADTKRYLSITGRAQIVVDPNEVAQLWQDDWAQWFPNGPRSRDIGLLQIAPLRAEYWDRSQPYGLQFGLEAAKAWFEDEPPKPPEGPEYHAKLGTN